MEQEPLFDNLHVQYEPGKTSVSQPTERYIERSVCDYAESLGWLVYKFVSPHNRGVPDRIFLKDNEAFFIEFKSPGGKMSALQKHHAKKLHGTNFDVYVIDNIDRGKKVIDAKSR